MWDSDVVDVGCSSGRTLRFRGLSMFRLPECRTVRYLGTPDAGFLGRRTPGCRESPGQRTGGLIAFILGLLIVRVYAEILIVVFRMNETLTEIRNNTDRS